MANEEMVTIASPDGAVAELDIASTGERFKARDGGMYDVPARIAPLIRELGGFVPNVGPMILKGPRCPCGFASYFAKCSRCGTDRRAVTKTINEQRTETGLPRVAIYGETGQLTMRAALANIAQAAKVVR